MECLQASVMLCSDLELHDRCGEMLEPLTSIICSADGSSGSSSNQNNKNSKNKKGKNAKKYGVIELVCVEDILINGFELASQSQVM